MVVARSCGLSRVSSSLALLMGAKENSVRQRLREWSYAKEDKRGRRRCEIDVRESFGPLLDWVLGWWRGEEKRLVLAMDATSLGKVFVVLVISVVYRGCAIPVAWQVLPANKPGSWQEPWLDLFAVLQGAIPEGWMVLVMADRGLYAHWLWEAIRACHWHPFLRINARHHFRPHANQKFRTLQAAFQQPGCLWSGSGTCFKTRSVEATLLVRWVEGFPEPWLILTDLPPQIACPEWYALRAWIECGFKHLKSAGWQWQHTRMLDPQRATRFWLVLAVATLWVLSVGGLAEAPPLSSSLESLPPTHIALRRPPAKPLLRLLSCFHRGLLLILTSLIAQKPLPPATFIPQSWPASDTYP
jgi:hypothetical protein